MATVHVYAIRLVVCRLVVAVGLFCFLKIWCHFNLSWLWPSLLLNLQYIVFFLDQLDLSITPLSVHVDYFSLSVLAIASRASEIMSVMLYIDCEVIEIVHTQTHMYIQLYT